MIEKEHVNISFSFTDEFDQKSEMNKTISMDSIDLSSQFEVLVEEFKNFMLMTGFAQSSVNKIQIVEKE